MVRQAKHNRFSDMQAKIYLRPEYRAERGERREADGSVVRLTIPSMYPYQITTRSSSMVDRH